MSMTIQSPSTNTASARNRRDYPVVYALCLDPSTVTAGPQLADLTRYAQILGAVLVDDGTGSDSAGIRAALSVIKLGGVGDGQIAGAVDDHIVCELAAIDPLQGYSPNDDMRSPE